MPGISRNVQHLNGSANTTASTLTFAGPARSILIQNTEQSAANDLLVSFDGGVNFKTLKRLAAFEIEARLLAIQVKSSAGSVAYEAVVTHD
ncbi:MAG: hypothetical protein R3244_03645 [Thermoanaerobaculia bacterium]|nr:hypothetical protein [Thermoanaerobaculia bacterium]